MGYSFVSNCLPLQIPFLCQNSHTTTAYTFVPPKLKLKAVSTKLCKTGDGELSSTKAPPPQLSQIPSKIHPSCYSALIQSCIDSNSFDVGKSIHAQMLSNKSFHPDCFVQTKILMLYARSGDLNDLYVARQLFDEMLERNLTSWNTMILCYANKEVHEEVLEIFLQMQMAGVLPDKFTFPSVVKACVAMGDEHGVLQVHGLIVKVSLTCNLVVGGTLVDGYARFGSMNDAVSAFDEIDGKNTVAWNAIIGGYVRLMRWEEAWQSFFRMRTSLDLLPDDFTFATVTRVCGALRSLDRGKQVHAELISYGFESSVFVGNSLIDMYVKCGDCRSCLRVFNCMKERDQVTWNSVISSQAQLGQFDNAVMLFKQMLESGYKSDRFNLGSVLMACAGLCDIETGRKVHNYLIKNLLATDVVLGSALIDMYSKSSCIEEARKTFDRLEEKNGISWNALLMGYVLVGQVEEALEHFHEMKMTDAQPDQFTFTSLLALSADKGNEDLGKQIHAHIIRTVARQNIILETELVHMYAKCGNLNYAQEIFNRMLETNAYSWNSLIVGYEQNGQAEKSLELFCRMQLTGTKADRFSLASALSACASLSDGKRGEQIHGYILRNALEEDVVLRSTLVDMYSKCGVIDRACNTYAQMSEKDTVLHNIMVSAYVSCNRIDDARGIFDQMEERSIISWNSMLAGYAKGGLSDEMTRFFQRMLEESNELDDLTFLTMFDLCASIPALNQGKQLHAGMVKRGYTHSSVILDSALVDMYAKGGDIEEARRLFNKMNYRNIISWNSMIAGYANHGDGAEVLALFDQMKDEGIYPNDVTFLSVLTACSHIGMVEEGLRIFLSMIEEHGIEARAAHYTCMVDLLGRAGHLDDAKAVIERMPIEPEISTWGALLGACRVHQNIDLGRFAAERLFALDPKNPGHYILLSNIYASAGRWKEADEVRNLMKLEGVTKEPGISWIEIDNETQIFHAGDRAHPRIDEIYAMLKSLSLRMKGMGYVPNSSFVLRNVENHEEYLLQHSERLAIALGLICLPEKATIRVFKNLRICGDCHTVVKLISKITHRQIIIRDTKRFHHFEDGLCSCRDYW